MSVGKVHPERCRIFATGLSPKHGTAVRPYICKNTKVPAIEAVTLVLREIRAFKLKIGKKTWEIRELKVHDVQSTDRRS